MKISLNIKLASLIASLVFLTAFFILAVVYNNLSKTVHKNINTGLTGASIGLENIINNYRNAKQEQLFVLLDSQSIADELGSSSIQSVQQALNTIKFETQASIVAKLQLNSGQLIADTVDSAVQQDASYANELSHAALSVLSNSVPFKTSLKQSSLDNSAFIVSNDSLFWSSLVKLSPQSSEALLLAFHVDEQIVLEFSENLGMNIALTYGNYPEYDKHSVQGEYSHSGPVAITSANEPVSAQELIRSLVDDNYLGLFNWRVMLGLQPYFTKQLNIQNAKILTTQAPEALSYDTSTTPVDFYLMINAQRVATNVIALHTTIALVSMIAVVIAIVLGAVLASRITRPIKQIAASAQSIASGNYSIPLELSNQPFEVGKLAGAFETMRTSIKEREATIRHQAQVDSLTGLYNRAQIKNEIEALFDKKQSFQAVGINISGFRGINDTFGFEFGDEALKCVAQRMGSYSGLCARLTGGKILFIPEQALSIDDLTALQTKLAESFSYDGISTEFKIAIGYLSCPKDALDAEGLFRRLSILFDESSQNTGRILAFDSSQEERYLRRLAIMNKLKQSLDNHGEYLSLVYQPKISLIDKSQLQLEALVRWNHPEFGQVPPDEFVAIAEQAGFIRLLTKWVMNQAFSDLLRFLKIKPGLKMAINVCADDILDTTFQSFALKTLARFNLPTNVCVLELTERVIVKNPDIAISNLSKLRQAGFAIAIDDFGTGYSSLAYLTDLPVDTLKIDRSFVFELAKNDEKITICKTIMSLAENFGLDSVAEGVEDQKSLDVLTSIGCQWAQGYFICKPIDADLFETWLRDNS
ncbi:putative bifunctional diguanylate cyclase/phosphodiesterase [Ningiella sp. W23]|uniref:putative bifunctional diguanylate cyclase/phosphodiesterase n=1 Tax=Ningiella sp. W23 TaxID=3023715 RepID=UPI003757C978